MIKTEHQVTVERLSHECRGIGKIGDVTTFIRGALPGETVTCTVVKKHRRYLDACATEITTPSADRTTPQCPHFLVCGGCSLQHINADAQVQYKMASLLEQLKQFGNLTPKEILTPIRGPSYGYRHKARLGVRYVIKKEKLLVGFREYQGRYLAEIDRCDILHPSVGHHLRDLSDMLLTMSIYRDIPQIEAAVGDDQTALIFRHLQPFSDNDLETLTRYGVEHHCQIYLQPGKPSSIHKLTPTNTPDRLCYRLPEQQLEFLFHPMDFTQINPMINRQMVTQALDLLQPNKNDTILDLFCGLGNFTLPIAQLAKSVTGIEGSKNMVLRLMENAAHNKLSNIKGVDADLTQDFTNTDWGQEHYDKLLIDPPRSGAEFVILQLGPKKIPKIVYISCNPATLARDSQLLTERFGYTLTKLGMMDMFPQTTHIESMALFELI